MSKLNINRNIFLEREEFLRFQKFMLESAVNKTFLANTINWGIIDTSGGETVQDFKVQAGTTPGSVKIAALSRALTSDGLIVEQSAIDNIAIPNDGNYYWIKAGHIYSNLETGLCSITSDGQVTGTSTLFTDVLRGQSLKTPVKIKFVNSANSGIYEVVDVIDDSNLILSGNSFTAELNLQYFVVGCTPIGETITSQQQLGLYFYDSCLLTKVLETSLNTEPAGKVQDKEFWIARVINNSGTVVIVDERTEYWEYYIKGVSDKLTKQNNLSDVVSVPEARANLDVYSTEEVDIKLGTDNVGWTPLVRGTAASATGFDLQACRAGRIITISGKYKGTASPVQGAIIASIPVATIAANLSLTNKIWSQSNDVSLGDTNKGIVFYVDVFDPITNPVLNLMVDSSVSADTLGVQYVFVNLTFLTM